MGLRAAGVRLERDHEGRCLPEGAHEPCRLLGRGRTEGGVLEGERAGHEERGDEDGLQAVVVGEVVPGGEAQLPRVPADHLPVPPTALGQLAAGDLHAAPFVRPVGSSAQ
ncbi:hypothetical protein ABT187_18650 [Streptomyces sp. NPDC001817]|uniref:hypothetical protein n=1 Tax=Streptomyces sp. NPDC001817 TaxID=3154398 RepID=UPI003331C132